MFIIASLKEIARRITILLFLILITANNTLISQNYIDSLKKSILTENTDSVKVYLLAKLAKELRYNNSDSSIICGLEGLEISEKSHYLSCEAICLYNLAMSYWVQDNYFIAMIHCINAIQIREKLNDIAGLCECYNCMGILLSSQHYDSLALVYYQKALDFSYKSAYHYLTSRIIGNIGELYFDQGKYDTALSFYNKALGLSIRNNDKVNTSTNLDYLGDIYYKTKNYSKATEYYLQSIVLAKEVNDNQNISNTSYSLACIFLETGITDKARYYAENSLHYARKIKYLSNIRKSAMILYDISLAGNNYKQALEYYKIAAIANDSLISATNEKEFRKKQQKYEMDTKQKEILLLLKDKKITEKEAKNRLLFTLLLLIVLSLLAIFSFFIFRNYKAEKKAKSLLAIQKAEITEKNEELNLLNEEVTVQRDILAKQRKNTTDSIKYARRIQNAILPLPGVNNKYFKESFVYNRPKDIVGGDFFWFNKVEPAEKKGETVYFALADCTGHGIPGAFMSILCYNIIEIVMEENPDATTDALLTSISNMIDKKLRQQQDDTQLHDGIDIAFCALHRPENILDYSGIRNSIVIIRNNELKEYKPDKKSSNSKSDKNVLYGKLTIQLEKGDSLYLFSDGFADQFNANNQKKYSMKKFKELLLEISALPVNSQPEKLHLAFENWKGETEQIDDVMVMGLKI